MSASLWHIFFIGLQTPLRNCWLIPLNLEKGRWNISPCLCTVCACVFMVESDRDVERSDWTAVFACWQLLGSEIQRTSFVGLRVRRWSYTGLQAFGAICDRLSHCLHIVQSAAFYSGQVLSLLQILWSCCLLSSQIWLTTVCRSQMWQADDILVCWQ